MGWRPWPLYGPCSPRCCFWMCGCRSSTGSRLLRAMLGQLPIVFTTAYDAFAVQAFDVDAVDYLLKPSTPVRLATAVARVRLRAQAETERIRTALRDQERPASYRHATRDRTVPGGTALL